ncbi:hypothetical protein CGRA01v4_04474 [Colletotrichum graminicola]|nr:hypothetical protein CGRA01v4_04474 [Colletotrichum graminicola]
MNSITFYLPLPFLQNDFASPSGCHVTSSSLVTTADLSVIACDIVLQVSRCLIVGPSCNLPTQCGSQGNRKKHPLLFLYIAGGR